MAAIVREGKYIKSDAGKNNNKYWYITEYDNGSVATEYGRVGKTAQSRIKDFGSQSQASAFFDKKVKEKTRKGRNGEIAYRQLDVVAGTSGVGDTTRKIVVQDNLQNLAEEQIGSGCKATAALIRYLVKVNVHNITSSTTMTYNNDTGLFSTPCGIVTQTSIDEANKLLANIGDFVAKDKYTKKMSRIVGDYLMLIPQDIGMKFDIEAIFPDLNAVQSQKAILDSLQASLDSLSASSKKQAGVKTASKKQEKVFSVKLKNIDEKKEIERIKKFYSKTINRGHSCSHLKVKTVYDVEIETMAKAFEKGKKCGKVMELWHGTRASNLLSILKGGLIIPPSSSSHCTGRLYGDGIYFSDQSTKSLNYSYGYWGGGKRGNA